MNRASLSGAKAQFDPPASHRRKNSSSVACAPWSLCKRVENGTVEPSPLPVVQAIGSRTPSMIIVRMLFGNMFAYVCPRNVPYDTPA